MIPANGDHEVIFGEGGPLGVFPVEAWDADGRPWIAGKKGLVRAGSVNHDWTVHPTDRARIVAAIPAPPGWTVKFAHTHDPEATWTEPVLGFAVAIDGDIEPIVNDEDEAMLLGNAIENSSKVTAKLIPPDTTP